MICLHLIKYSTQYMSCGIVYHVACTHAHTHTHTHTRTHAHMHAHMHTHTLFYYKMWDPLAVALLTIGPIKWQIFSVCICSGHLVLCAGRFSNLAGILILGLIMLRSLTTLEQIIGSRDLASAHRICTLWFSLCDCGCTCNSLWSMAAR